MDQRRRCTCRVLRLGGRDCGRESRNPRARTTRPTCWSPMPTTIASCARTESFAGRVITFGIERPRRCPGTSVDDRGLEGTRATVRTPKGEVRLETPLLGLRQSGERACRHCGRRRSSTCRSRLSPIAPLACSLRRIAASCCGFPAASQSLTIPTTRARRRCDALSTSSRLRPAVRARSPCSARCSSSGRTRSGLHRECGARRRCSRARSADRGWRSLGASRWPIAAIAGGMPAGAVLHAATSAEAAEFALQRTRPGDLVLVKGSRGIGTDVVVDRLRAEYA